MSWYSKSVKPIDEYTSAVIAGIWRSISVVALIGLVLALLFLGCGSGFRWDGDWAGNRNLKVPPGENPGAFRTIGQVSLTIEAGSFTLREMGIVFRGPVRFDDGKAFLKIESAMDNPLEKPLPEIELTPGSDGTTINYVNPGGEFTEPLTLQREAKKKKP